MFEICLHSLTCIHSVLLNGLSTGTNSSYSFNVQCGRAIAQEVSRWLPTATARIRSRVWSSGICSGQSGAGAGFLRVLRFPLPITISPIAPQSPSPIIWPITVQYSTVAAVQGT
jgi:hypothetical protein